MCRCLAKSRFLCKKTLVECWRSGNVTFSAFLASFRQSTIPVLGITPFPATSHTGNRALGSPPSPGIVICIYCPSLFLYGASETPVSDLSKRLLEGPFAWSTWPPSRQFSFFFLPPVISSVLFLVPARSASLQKLCTSFKQHHQRGPDSAAMPPLSGLVVCTSSQVIVPPFSIIGRKNAWVRAFVLGC